MECAKQNSAETKLQPTALTSITPAALSDTIGIRKKTIKID
jgi:hypothetical protein